MKRQYLSPQSLVVDIQPCQLIASSEGKLDFLGGDDDGGGGGGGGGGGTQIENPGEILAPWGGVMTDRFEW